MKLIYMSSCMGMNLVLCVLMSRFNMMISCLCVLTICFYLCRFARVGAVVLALHDASDVFLEVAKMSKYSGCEWMASLFFVVFVLSWTILRLIYYPFWILWSTG